MSGCAVAAWWRAAAGATAARAEALAGVGARRAAFRDPHGLARRAEALGGVVPGGVPVVARAAARHPMLLTADAGRVARNVAVLKELLRGAAVSDEGLQRSLVRQPRLLTSDPNTLVAKLDALRGLLPRSVDCATLVAKNPGLLMSGTETVGRKLAALRELLPPDLVWGALAAAPNAASGDPRRLADNLASLAELLPRWEAARVAGAQLSLLSIDPAVLKGKWAALTAATDRRAQWVAERDNWGEQTVAMGLKFAESRYERLLAVDRHVPDDEKAASVMTILALTEAEFARRYGG